MCLAKENKWNGYYLCTVSELKIKRQIGYCKEKKNNISLVKKTNPDVLCLNACLERVNMFDV